MVLKEVDLWKLQTRAVKFTFEMELNQPIMELVRQDIDMMMDLATQGADIWRKNIGERRKGHGMGMMMHGHE